MRIDGADRPTSFVNKTQLKAQILADDIAGTCTARIAVFNPAPGGGTSNEQSLKIVVP